MTTAAARHRLATALSLAGSTVTIAGIASASTAWAAEKMPIGVSVADQKSLFYVAAVDGMKDKAAKQGYELKIASASNNSRLQIKQTQDLIV